MLFANPNKVSDFPLTIAKIKIQCPSARKVMHQTRFSIDEKEFSSLEGANNYLFTELRDRLRFPTSKQDVVKIQLRLVDKSVLFCRIPLRFRVELLDFLSTLHYSRNTNIISYYSMKSIHMLFRYAIVSGISPFSKILIKDMEQRIKHNYFN
ncbi:MAG: hypothetical protein HeimC2_09420 [Candidatus Heimdallarchaeota archaeon LC_2]|nr:MAG: hypothetical protein HeimC2_09420 [Candidatus Heimdallarchaeota archaeon LC_2]